ncbi:MAG: O-antigen ligase family protein [Sphingomonadales bacterium]|nr:O-antigen ligase family protein [Sphingomonadales bacterium]
MNDPLVYSLIPVALLAIYFAIFQTEKLFLSLAFLTPLSINIEEYTSSFGLFVPTEPLLFGLMLLLGAFQIKKAFVPLEIWRSPLLWAITIYILWLLLSALTSSHPIVSFKFILARLWFIVPMLYFGTYFFQKKSNRIWFLWLFIVATVIVIIYTLIHHSFYGFGEKEGHWVMSPFFKDHTIYGAIVALILPLAVGLYLYKKHNPLIQLTLISLILIILVGLVLSYTRAAWLSVLGSIGIAFVLYYKVSWKPIAALAGIALVIVLIRWDQIQIELERNKYEHTTESFDERLQSAANISTDASNLERINRWSCAIAMFKKRPLMGYGPGTYAFEYAPFQRPENLTIISTNFGDMGNAHSEYLGALAETGLIGMLSFIAVVAAIFYTGFTLYHRLPKENKDDRIIVLSTIMALSTYFIHAFLNNYLDTDKAAVPIWGICALWLVYEKELGISGQSIKKD